MIIRRETIKAVIPATSHDDTRYFLTAVQIEPDGTVVATNGHVLLTAKDRSAFVDADFPQTARTSTQPVPSPDKPVLLKAETAERLIGAMPKRSPIPILQAVQIAQDDKGAYAVATDLQIPVTVDLEFPGENDAGQFPSWRRVMPKDDQPYAAVKLGVPVLEALIKAAKAVTTQKVHSGPFITLEIPIALEAYAGKDHTKGLISAFRVRIAGTDVDVDGCAMPVRVVGNAR